MLFDYSKSGRISARDIGPVIRSVGLKPSQAEIRSITSDVQQSGMSRITVIHVNFFSIDLITACMLHLEQFADSHLMPMTHLPEIGAKKTSNRKQYQEASTGFSTRLTCTKSFW